MPAKMFMLVLAAAAGCQICSLSAGEFPYHAYVAVDQAEVVAGPGHRFYATERLPRGTAIEIYREEPSGWLAIRPPAGAFSWTVATAIERLKDDPSLGRVKEPSAAWIGTAAEEVREHRQQVTLQAGEMVQVLGDKLVETHGQNQRWLKISPPAGEFRWIHLRDVSRQKPVEEPAPEERAAEDPAQRFAESKSLASGLSQRERDATAAEPGRFQVGQRAIAVQEIDEPRHGGAALAQFQAAASDRSASLSPDGFVPRKRRSGEPTEPLASGSAQPRRATNHPLIRQPGAAAAPAISGPRPSTSQAVSVSLPAAPDSHAGLIQQQLDQIEVDLSLMLAQNQSQWNLEPLRVRVQQLVEQGADPVARGQARLLLDKLKQFEQAFAAPRGGLSGGSLAASLSATAETPAAERAPAANAHYDAQGWLKPVVSRKSEKPAAPYAVVDKDGQPLCFITPSPGLNLNRYLNKQVGLYGRRGLLEDLNKPHVLAERVIDLERMRR